MIGDSLVNTHPAVLRNQLTTYESLRGEATGDVVPLHVRRQLQDIAYALCVSTGARDIEAALAVARRELDDDRDPLTMA
ncbi:DUF5133 domain-containing protein [Streptomyces sp. NPDC004609]|uniref:DUF5133 domain-containing protein n=1 Tax=Streptomyces sp. NPDC004609 TaxID=3364704 RepID=UPI003682A9F1